MPAKTIKGNTRPFIQCLRYPLLIVWLLYILLVVYLSLMPVQSHKGFLFSIPGIDKIAHFLMYLIMAFLTSLVLLISPGAKIKPAVLLSFLIAALFGFCMELLQNYLVSAYRSFEFRDILSNIAGAFSGAFIAYFLLLRIDANSRKKNRSKKLL